MATKRFFEHDISPDDRIDMELEVDAGDVVGFTANDRARIGGRWVEVVRYDTAHGHLHLHRFWRPEESQIETLEDPGSPKGIYNAELDQAEADLVENWQTYRHRMEESLR